MKKAKVISMAILIVMIIILSLLPKQTQASDPVKMPGWWVGDTCVCPIIWMSDCDCIIKR
mgnify:CR=1 FL=1